MLTPLPLQWTSRLDAHHFFVGASNASAFAWIQRWPWPHNCMCLYGPPGSGKTHLASIWTTRHDAIFLPTLEALPSKPNQTYVLDTVSPPWTEAQERDLFSFYNALVEEGGHCLWTSLTPPAHWSIVLPDLASRLRTIPCVELNHPDDAVLFQVLGKCFQDHDLPILPEVLTFLVHHIPRSFQALHTAIAHIHTHLLREKRPLTLFQAKKALGDWLQETS